VDAFLARFDALLAATKRREGGVSEVVFGSSRKVRGLRAGDGVGVYTLAEAEEKLARLAAEAGVTLPDAAPARNSAPQQGEPGASASPEAA
jgi:hypothetical protein